jgi:hypothetical protein
MNNAEKVKEYYNNGQDKYRITDRNGGIYESADKHSTWRVNIKSLEDDELMNRGFYEWLWNEQKYHVFKTLKLDLATIAYYSTKKSTQELINFIGGIVG